MIPTMFPFFADINTQPATQTAATPEATDEQTGGFASMLAATWFTLGSAPAPEAAPASNVAPAPEAAPAHTIAPAASSHSDESAAVLAKEAAPFNTKVQRSGPAVDASPTPNLPESLPSGPTLPTPVAATPTRPATDASSSAFPAPVAPSVGQSDVAGNSPGETAGKRVIATIVKGYGETLTGQSDYVAGPRAERPLANEPVWTPSDKAFTKTTPIASEVGNSPAEKGGIVVAIPASEAPDAAGMLSDEIPAPGPPPVFIESNLSAPDPPLLFIESETSAPAPPPVFVEFEVPIRTPAQTQNHPSLVPAHAQARQGTKDRALVSADMFDVTPKGEGVAAPIPRERPVVLDNLLRVEGAGRTMKTVRPLPSLSAIKPLLSVRESAKDDAANEGAEVEVVTGPVAPQAAAGNARLDVTSAPVAESATETEVVGQTAERILVASERLAPREERAVKIRLRPEELGHVEVVVARDGEGRLSAHLTAQQDAARQALADGLGALRQTLEQAGLVIDQLDVNTGAQAHRHADDDGRGQRQSANAPFDESSSTNTTAVAEDARPVTDRLLSVRA